MLLLSLYHMIITCMITLDKVEHGYENNGIRSNLLPDQGKFHSRLNCEPFKACQAPCKLYGLYV